MTEALTLLLAGVAGGLLGVLFFGGLWFTVRKGLSSEHPALWFFGSMLLRTAFVLVGFYFIAIHGLDRLLVSLLGFVIARLVVAQVTITSVKLPCEPEGHHAP